MYWSLQPFISHLPAPAVSHLEQQFGLWSLTLRVEAQKKTWRIRIRPNKNHPPNKRIDRIRKNLPVAVCTAGIALFAKKITPGRQGQNNSLVEMRTRFAIVSETFNRPGLCISTFATGAPVSPWLHSFESLESQSWSFSKDPARGNNRSVGHNKDPVEVVVVVQEAHMDSAADHQSFCVDHQSSVGGHRNFVGGHRNFFVEVDSAVDCAVVGRAEHLNHFLRFCWEAFWNIANLQLQQPNGTILESPLANNVLQIFEIILKFTEFPREGEGTHCKK